MVRPKRTSPGFVVQSFMVVLNIWSVLETEPALLPATRAM